MPVRRIRRPEGTRDKKRNGGRVRKAGPLVGPPLNESGGLPVRGYRNRLKVCLADASVGMGFCIFEVFCIFVNCKLFNVKCNLYGFCDLRLAFKASGMEEVQGRCVGTEGTSVREGRVF